MTSTAVQAAHAGRRAHAPGARTQTTGLVLLALAPLVMFAAGAITGADLGEGSIFLVIGAILAIGAGLTVAFGTWSKVVGLVLTVLAALGGFWIAFGLMAPNSPVDFVVGVMFVTGVVLAITGGVQALRHRRERVDAPTAGESRARLVALGLVGLALVASLAVNLLTRSSVAVADAEGAASLEIGAFAFPSVTTVAAGEEARLLVHNADAFLHDVAIPAGDIGPVTVAPGSEVLVDISALSPGTYTYYCTLHSDTAIADPEEAGMAGTLVVE